MYGPGELLAVSFMPQFNKCIDLRLELSRGDYIRIFEVDENNPFFIYHIYNWGNTLRQKSNAPLWWNFQPNQGIFQFSCLTEPNEPPQELWACPTALICLL